MAEELREPKGGGLNADRVGQGVILRVNDARNEQKWSKQRHEDL